MLFSSVYPEADSSGDGDDEEDNIDETSMYQLCRFIHSNVHNNLAIGGEDRKLYQEAMRKGCIVSAFALLILLGVTGSGKSLFKRLVLGLPVPEFSPSTPLAESAVRSMDMSTLAESAVRSMDMSKVALDGVKWVIVEPNTMIDMVATAIKKRDFQFEKNDSESSQSDSTTAQQSGQGNIPQSPVQQEHVVPQSSLSLEIAPYECQTHPTQKGFSLKFLNALKTIKIDSQLIQKMTESSETAIQSLMNVKFIYLLDSGGQPPFREMLPHFVQESSAFVLTQKLNEKLDFKPRIRYREKRGKVDEGYESPLTNEQILYQYVQAVQSQNSKVFVVGTHKDKEMECTDETRAMKDKKLIEAFDKVIDQLEMYMVGDPDQLMFPVDSTSRGKEVEEVAQVFKKRVMQTCMDNKMKIPLPWFVLEKLLELLAQKMGVNVLSIEECCEAAKRKLLMPRHECGAAINYLGKLNIIFYRPDILPDVVFSNAQIILDKITELVRCNHALRTKGGTTSAVPSCMQSNEKRKFRDFGQVTPMLLKNAFPSHYRDRYFTAPHFLKLLEGLMIAGRLENGEHFIPSLLPDLPAGKIAGYRASQKHPAALVIHYPKKWVPVGVMPSLVVYLQNNCQWTLTRSSPTCVYHNCIQFQLPGGKPGSVVLIDSTKFLEIHVRTTLVPDSKLCTDIGNDVLKGLKEAHKSLHYDSAEAEIGFLCSGGCGIKEAHVATLDANREAWRCSEDQNTGEYLDERHTYWIEILRG